MNGHAGGSQAPLSVRAATALIAAGLMAGHWLVFALREPDAGARAILLEGTGHHGWWPLAVAAIASALAVPLRRFRPGGGSWTLRLAAAQSGGFLLLETLERVSAHAGHEPSAVLLADPVLLPGVAIQFALALAVAALLAGLLRLPVAALAAWALPHGPRRAQPIIRVLRRAARQGRSLRTLRGPPHLSLHTS